MQGQLEHPGIVRVHNIFEANRTAYMVMQYEHGEGLDRLLEAQLVGAPAERRHDLELVKQLVGQHIKRLGMYKCEHCGFRAKQYYWRCPGCGKWETYSPRRTETPDGYA